jgi:molybdopterin molybdotransferase
VTTVTSWGRARRAAREAAGPLPVVEVPLTAAVGAVLAHPLVSATSLPPVDAADTDGWAVAGPGPWEVVELADSDHTRLPDGTAAWMPSGAGLPAGSDAVLRRNRGLVLDGSGGVRLYVGDSASGRTAPHPGYVEPGTDIRPRGQEATAGEVLLDAGGIVTPVVAGLAAAAGYDTLSVVRPPDVAILVLGDQLLARGRARDGRARDALGPMLPGWIAWAGGRAFPPVRVPDTLADLVAEIDDVNADIVLVTGATGDHGDLVHDALARFGARWVVDGVGVVPGGAMCLGTLPDGRHVLGLPDTPLGAVAAVLTLAVPLLASMRGEVGADEARVEEALLDADAPSHPEHVTLVPVSRQRGELVTSAVPVTFTGPAMLRGLAVADGMAVIPAGGGARGSGVAVLPLP